MKVTLKVSEAAEFLQIDAQQIRIGLQKGSLPIGSAIGKPSKTRKGFTVYHYHIPKAKVENYMGVSYEEFLKSRK